MVGRLGHFNETADFDEEHALGDELLGGFELTDDLLGCMPGTFNGQNPSKSGMMGSHQPWIDHRGPRHRA